MSIITHGLLAETQHLRRFLMHVLIHRIILIVKIVQCQVRIRPLIHLRRQCLGVFLLVQPAQIIVGTFLFISHLFRHFLSFQKFRRASGHIYQVIHGIIALFKWLLRFIQRLFLDIWLERALFHIFLLFYCVCALRDEFPVFLLLLTPGK